MTLPTLSTGLSRITSAVLISVFFIVLGVGAGMWLLVGGVQTYLTKLQTAQGLVQAAESQQELIRQSRDALTREKDNIARLEALFVPKTQNGVVAFVESLESVASSTAVTLTVTSPITVPLPEGPYAQSFDVTMKGKYANIFNMIALLEQSGALKRFETLDLSRVGEEYQARGTLVVATE